MIIFLPVLILCAWLEAAWAYELRLAGVSLPLTLLILLYIASRRWLKTRELLLLAALAGYWLDELASPKPALVMAGLLTACALGVWLLRVSHRRWQRLAIIGLSLLVYQWLLALGMGWTGAADIVLDGLVFTAVSLATYTVVWMVGQGAAKRL